MSADIAVFQYVIAVHDYPASEMLNTLKLLLILGILPSFFSQGEYCPGSSSTISAKHLLIIQRRPLTLNPLG